MITKKHFVILLITILSAIFFAACEEETVSPETPAEFAIVGYHLPGILSSLSDRPVLLSVEVSHPMGSAGISSAALVISDSAGNQLETREFYDEGGAVHPESGDAVALDGVFSLLIVPSGFGLPDGNYSLKFIVTSVDGETAESMVESLRIFPNQQPQILNLVFPDTIRPGMPETDVLVTVRDEDGLDDIVDVTLQAFDLQTGGTSQIVIPNPMDNSPVFSVQIDSGYGVAKNGNFELRVFAKDQVGEYSDTLTIQVFVNNTPPSIYNARVPDTLFLPVPGGPPVDTLVTVQVKDLQSLADVDSVYFLSLKPNGEYANNGNPIVMQDNGLPFDPSQSYTVGDEVAGDGIYSYTTLLFSDAEAGTYVFTFSARDKSGQLSTVLKDSIQVVQ